MSVTRSCASCRTAKARCDLARPRCGRCTQRDLTCEYAIEAGFVFRDQTDTARRNSERARRETAGASSSFKIIVPSPSAPLARDPGQRAVEKFFINWTLNPEVDGYHPGHLRGLAELYSRTAPKTALWHAVRAIATADERHFRHQDVSFDVLARRHYGHALAQLRENASDQERMTQDTTLAALMLIDNFEVVYLARSEPLGPHGSAVRHMLHLKRDEDIFCDSRSALWRVAYDRLQARQILFREGPQPEQIEWLEQLQRDTPDLQICYQKLRMNVLCAEVRKFVHNPDEGGSLTEQIERGQRLARQIEELLDSFDTFARDIPDMWKPELLGAECLVQAPSPQAIAPMPIPRMPCATILAYRNLWQAYLWDFHAASQIVVRESLIELLEHLASLKLERLNEHDSERVQFEERTVQRLSSTLIEAFPQLMGFISLPARYTSPRQGVMVGRFFILFSMWVIQRAKLTSRAHKDFATELLGWIKSTHGLG